MQWRDFFICIKHVWSSAKSYEGGSKILMAGSGRKWFFLVLSLFLVTSAPSISNSTESSAQLSLYPIYQISALQLPSNAKWSFSAVNTKTGGSVLETGNASNTPLMPGSLEKMLVTAALLDIEADTELTFDTILATDAMVSSSSLKGNIYLRGSGNAFLSTEDFRAAADALVKKGIREIAGGLTVDETIFDTKGHRGYTGPAYAPPAGLGLDLHTVSISVSGYPPVAKIDPPNELVKVVVSSEGSAGIHQLDDLNYRVSGYRGEGTLRARFSLQSPALYAGAVFVSVLKEKGIDVKGSVTLGPQPSSAFELYKIRSKGLASIVKDVNTYSLNVAAENLLLTIGMMKYGAPGTTEKGLQAINVFLHDLGVPSEGMVIADGSGISIDNRLTSAQVATFLQKITTKPWFKTFYDSLPRAGMDGTLKDIGFSSERVRAKTGKLRDACCIAGYIEGRQNELTAFAYMINVPGADILPKQGIAELLKILTGEGS